VAPSASLAWLTEPAIRLTLAGEHGAVAPGRVGTITRGRWGRFAGAGPAAAGRRRPSPAALRHNDNASGCKRVGCAPPSCSPPESARLMSPASSACPSRASISGTSAGRRGSRRPAQPRPDRSHPSFSDAQLAQVEQALLEGAGANGFVGELWTLDRIAIVIHRLTGADHHPAWGWALLRHRLGWSVQRPVRRPGMCLTRATRNPPPLAERPWEFRTGGVQVRLGTRGSSGRCH
jgi:hypothetical protein